MATIIVDIEDYDKWYTDLNAFVYSNYLGYSIAKNIKDMIIFAYLYRIFRINY